MSSPTRAGHDTALHCRPWGKVDGMKHVAFMCLALLPLFSGLLLALFTRPAGAQAGTQLCVVSSMRTSIFQHGKLWPCHDVVERDIVRRLKPEEHTGICRVYGPNIAGQFMYIFCADSNAVSEYYAMLDTRISIVNADGEFHALVNPPPPPAKPAQKTAPLNPDAALAPTLSGGAMGLRLALIIGNNAYANAARLNNPASDAKAMAAALRRLGFTEVLERYDLGLQQLSAELKSFGDKAGGADWAVVYFAGHGIQVDGQTYLVPTDANLARAGHAADEAIPLDRVLAKVADARQMRLVILDACRSNPFLPRMAQNNPTRDLGRGLARVEITGGVLVAYAARDGQVADDGVGMHSPFTQALLDHLEQPGLEIGLLFRKVRDAVLKRTGGAQEPYTYGSIPSEELYFKARAK